MCNTHDLNPENILFFLTKEYEATTTHQPVCQLTIKNGPNIKVNLESTAIPLAKSYLYILQFILVLH